MAEVLNSFAVLRLDLEKGVMTCSSSCVQLDSSCMFKVRALTESSVVTAVDMCSHCWHINFAGILCASVYLVLSIL